MGPFVLLVHTSLFYMIENVTLQRAYFYPSTVSILKRVWSSTQALSVVAYVGFHPCDLTSRKVLGGPKIDFGFSVQNFR